MITAQTLIIDAVQQGNSEEVIKVLTDIGMHCFSCAFAHAETVEEAALVHGLDVDELVAKLNEAASTAK